jgi:serine/threonine-protein kinase
MSHVARDEAFAKYVRQTGMATDAQVEEARSSQGGDPLAEALVRLGVITPTQKEAVEKKLDSQGISAIGGCRLIRKLGEGGMGAVYLAERADDGRRVALKILPKKHASDVEFLKRFHREAEAAAALEHENIARGYAAGEEKGYHYYLMEYCEGETLGRRLKRGGAQSVREASGWILQVARGLAYAHERGFVHRDVKPDNLLLTASGVVKILDLGLSKNIDEAGGTFNTATGAAIGTPHYLPPEQARGEKTLDGRADLYALGATYYHLVTGATPYNGSSVFEVINKHLTEPLPDPRDVRPDVPEGVAHVIRRLMAKRPEDRYPDAKALTGDLERALKTQAPAAGPPPAPPSRTPLWIAAGTAGLALLLAGVWWLTPPPRIGNAEARPSESAKASRRPEPKRPDPPKPKIEPVVEKTPTPETKPPEPELPKPEPPPLDPPKPEPLKTEPEPVKPPEPPRPAGNPAEASPRSGDAKAGPRPEPAPAAIKDAEAAFREPLKAEYALTGISDRAALAAKLLAMTPPADPVQDYVRLRDARDLAARGADAAGVLAAVDALAQAFVLRDVLGARTDGLAQLARSLTTDGNRDAARACLAAAVDAIQADRYDLSSKLLSKAEAAAKDAEDEDLAARARVKAQEAAGWSKELASMSGYVDDLRKNPHHLAGNLALGKFACYLKNDWPTGLPRLAKVSDPILRALAQKDLSDPEDPTAQAELCDGWLKQAENERGVRKENILRRARMWFDKAASRLTPAEHERLSKRLGTPPPKPAVPKAPVAPNVVRAPNGRQGVDLLPLLDGPLCENGEWVKTGGALVSTRGGDNINRGSVRAWIPYAPPEGDYELFIEVERLEGMEDLVIGLAAPDGKPIAIGFDGWGQAAGSGMFIDGQWRKLVDRRVFENSPRRYSIGIHVRRDLLRVMVNAQEIMRSTTYASLSMPPHVQIPSKAKGLVIGAVRSRFAVRQAWVISNTKDDHGQILPR